MSYRPAVDVSDRLTARVEGSRDALVGALSEAIAIPSVVPTFPGERREDHLGREGDVARLLARVLEGCGCEIDVFGLEPGRENCVAVLRGRGGGRSLILNGHVDVVPPQPDSDWTGGDPWSGRVDDGQVWGRGACDMKGGLLAEAFALRAVAESGIRLRGDLIFQAVVGEEMMEHELGTTACLERGYRADAAVVAEPSPHGAPLAICPTTPGVMWFTVTAMGKGAHSGMRAETIRRGGAGSAVGVNAADLAWLLQGELLALERDWSKRKHHPLFRPGSFTVHTGVVYAAPAAGPMPFGLAEKAVLECILWHAPDDDPDTVRHEVEARLRAVGERPEWRGREGPRIEWRHHWPAAKEAVDSEIVAALRAAHAAAHGDQPTVEGFAAVADSTYLQRGGVPAVTYGPGDIALAHAADERIAIDEVVAAARTYALLAAGWCGT
jgi:acetylornithine deacetylase/succinyl-diaminopimelate desuccinylase family protein